MLDRFGAGYTEQNAALYRATRVVHTTQVCPWRVLDGVRNAGSQPRQTLCRQDYYLEQESVRVSGEESAKQGHTLHRSLITNKSQHPAIIEVKLLQAASRRLLHLWRFGD